MPRKKTSVNKTYFYEGVAYELVNFRYKRQVTFEDCQLQFVSTLVGNDIRGMSNASRKNGLPDEFGEGLARHHYPNLVSFNADKGKKGDMLDEKNPSLHEIKTLTSKGPTSFSPTSKSEWYVFCVVDMKTSEYKIYRVPHSLLSIAEINSLTTMAQQWAANEAAIADKKTAPRPRFNIVKFLEKNNIEPNFFGYLLESSRIEMIKEHTESFWSRIKEMTFGDNT